MCVCFGGGGGGGGGGPGIFKQENIYEYLFEHKETMRSDLLSPTICKVEGGGGGYFTCTCIGK